MTDNEIIEALECCIAMSGKGCAQCHYHKYFEECRTKRNNDCIDLINRQKAEINKLKKDKYILKDGNLELLPRTDIDIIKSEAIKEFAVKLCEGRVSNDPVVIAVKTELKEMVGDSDA